MNKRMKTSKRSTFTLGELIAAVSAESRNSNEAMLAVTDLLRSGRVSLGRPSQHRRRA